MSWNQVRRGVAALLTALAVSVVGIGAVSEGTAQAAGVVVDHRAWGSPLGVVRDD